MVEEKVRWNSLFCHRRVRLIKLIRKLYEVTEIHMVLFFDNQVSGNSISDGVIIFSIVRC